MSIDLSAARQTRRRHASTAVLILVALSAIFCLTDEEPRPGSALMLQVNEGLIVAAEEDADAYLDGEDENDEDDEAIDGLLMAGGRRSLSISRTDAMQGIIERNHRGLQTLEDIDLDTDYDAAFDAAYNSEPRNKYVPPTPIRPYAITDAASEAKVFEYTFAVLVYNPQEDNFVGMYSRRHAWTASNKKLFVSMSYLAFLLRRLFPERFTPDQPELAIAIGSGDYPHVKLTMLPHTDGVAPVLEFGSAFRDSSLYPNMVAMPMPERHHLVCFEEWVASGTVCKKLKPAEKGGNGELVFGDKKGLKYDDLIPQMIWRGSDFSYLPSLARPRPVKPYAFKLGEGEKPTKAAAIRALRGNYDQILPRWKGVVLTAESEQEAKRAGPDALPKFNIKFTQGSTKVKFRDPERFYLEGDRVRKLRANAENEVITYEDMGIASGGFTSLHELANYKYHIDLGGGGGTTWTGTIQKLAMPGLLFHHITPTKDFFHDRLQPWRHYIPVASDLSDLKLKLEWAESNPEKAKWIADQGTAFMRNFVSEKGYGQLFQEDFVEPLRQVIEAYQPVSVTHPGQTWMEVLQGTPEGALMEPIAECSGRQTRGSCRPLGVARGRGGVPKRVVPAAVQETLDQGEVIPAKIDNSENHSKLRGRVGTFSEIVGKK